MKFLPRYTFVFFMFLMLGAGTLIQLFEQMMHGIDCFIAKRRPLSIVKHIRVGNKDRPTATKCATRHKALVRD